MSSGTGSSFQGDSLRNVRRTESNYAHTENLSFRISDVIYYLNLNMRFVARETNEDAHELLPKAHFTH